MTLKENNTKATKLSKKTSVTRTSSVENREKTTMDNKQPDPKVYRALIGRKLRS